jgi:NAD(P)-dependent dehydrogenase (short-subunit alcohol dehydrogenase family)
VLINNAGIISYATPFLSQLRETFETNTFGPAVIADTFAPLLLKSNDARLIYVSSDLGSIAMRGGKQHGVDAAAYRMSKAALNMLMMCNKVQFEGKVKCWAFNPGFVVTDLSRTGEKGIQERRDRGAGDPRESAEALLEVVNGRRDKDVGGFVHKDGVHPW